MKVLIMDPASAARSGWHEIFGDSIDALNGNISRVFLTGVPFTVNTTDCRQPDGWSCGPYALAECLGQNSGKSTCQWLLDRGLITPQHGTEYVGIVQYLNVNGYSCEYDGINHDGQMTGAFYDKMIDHLKSGHKIILCMHHDRTSYWTGSGHYICVYDIENQKIKEDGLWGPETTTASQRVFKTSVDGIVSNQNEGMTKYLPYCQHDSWQFVPEDKTVKGSELIRAIQIMIGANPDGQFGPDSVKRFEMFFNISTAKTLTKKAIKAYQNFINSKL